MCICNSMIFHHQCSSAVFTFTERGDGSTFDYLPWMVTINKLKALHVGVKDPSHLNNIILMKVCIPYAA